MAILTPGTNSYVTLVQFNDYIACLINGQDTATDDLKTRALITAFFIFQRANWQGEKTGGTAQVPAWPRTGVICNGTSVDSATVPEGIINGQMEYANLLIADAALATSPTGAATTGLRRVQAGSAQVEFFSNNPNVIINASRRFPPSVFEYVSCFLDTVDFSATQLVSGLSDKSSFDQDNQYDLSDGYP